MKAIICDRCSEIIQIKSPLEEGLRVTFKTEIADEQFDLCGDCKEDFKKIFLNKKYVDQFKAMREVKK